MTDRNLLPLGIRNHNPGNLRCACWKEGKTHLVNGYAVFLTDQEGLTNLAACIAHFYFGLRLNTLASFVGRFAPASENDLLSYENFMARWLGYTPSDIGARDLALSEIAQAAHFMLGLIRVECGVPTPKLMRGHEWFTQADALRAVMACGFWGAAS